MVKEMNHIFKNIHIFQLKQKMGKVKSIIFSHT